MTGKFSIWREIFGKRLPAQPSGAMFPEVGDLFIHQPAGKPVEYAEVIGVYTEAAQIRHIRFRLYFGYQDKTEDLGEKTLSAALFSKRFQRRLETEKAAE